MTLQFALFIFSFFSEKRLYTDTAFKIRKMAPLFHLSYMLQQLLTVLRLPADWQVARAVVLLDFSHRKQQPPASEAFKAAGYEAGRWAAGGKEH